MAIAFSDGETPAGVLDGTNSVFTLAYTPSPAASLILVLNGFTQRVGTDFTLTGGTIAFLTGPRQQNDTLEAWYRYNPATPLAPFTGVVIDDLLRSSFRCIGQLRPGFGHSPSERVDALFILNAMLDSWSTDDLNAYCELIQSFPITPGQSVYTLGVGGAWNGARPVKIDKATLVVLTNPVQPLRLNLDVYNDYQWQSINLQSTASTLAQRIYFAPTFPLATVKLWPVPTEGDAVEISSSQMISNGFTSGTDAFNAPPGYLDAVRYQLAIRLAMEWDKPLKDGVVALASEALAKIQRLNATTPQMECNPGVISIGGGRSSFNRLTGD